MDKKISANMAYAFIIFQGLLFGFGDAVSKIAYNNLSVYSVLVVRFAIGIVVMMIFFGKRIIKTFKETPLKKWFMPCACLALSLLVGNMSIKLGSATSAAFLRSLGVVMTPMIVFARTKKGLGWKNIIILVFVVIGMYLLCGYGGLTGFGMGEVLALLSAFLLSATLVFSEEAVSDCDPIFLSTMQTALAGIISLVMAFATEGGLCYEGADFTIWSVIVYLAIGALAGYILQNFALQAISSNAVVILQSPEPIFTAICARILVNEKLSSIGTTGAVIILVSVVAETLVDSKTER